MCVRRSYVCVCVCSQQYLRDLTGIINDIVAVWLGKNDLWSTEPLCSILKPYWLFEKWLEKPIHCLKNDVWSIDLLCSVLKPIHCLKNDVWSIDLLCSVLKPIHRLKNDVWSIDLLCSVLKPIHCLKNDAWSIYLLFSLEACSMFEKWRVKNKSIMQFLEP